MVINDRWGSDTRGHHGGFFTPEYSAATYADHKWEENSGIDRFSFGYNRDSKAEDYLPVDYLVRLLVRRHLHCFHTHCWVQILSC